MRERARTLWTMIAVLALVVPGAVATADEVVLRDGQVLVGQPTVDGQTLRLAMPTGEVRVYPLSAVDRIRHDPGAGQPIAVAPRPLLVPTPPEPCEVACPPPCDPCEDPCDACKWDGPWSLSGGLSWTQAGGNSDSLSLKLEAELLYDRAPWRWVASAFYAYAESGGSVDTQRTYVETKLDRDITSRLFAFVMGSYDTDEPASLDYRVIGTAGVGMTFREGACHRFWGEIGAGGTLERRTGAAEEFDPSAYLGLDYEREWEKAGKITLDFDYLPNLDDYDLSLIRFDAKYELPLSSCLSLRLGLRIDYQFEPLDPEVRELDWIASAGLSVSF